MAWKDLSAVFASSFLKMGVYFFLIRRQILIQVAVSRESAITANIIVTFKGLVYGSITQVFILFFFASQKPVTLTFSS